MQFNPPQPTTHLPIVISDAKNQNYSEIQRPQESRSPDWRTIQVDRKLNFPVRSGWHTFSSRHRVALTKPGATVDH